MYKVSGLIAIHFNDEADDLQHNDGLETRSVLLVTAVQAYLRDVSRNLKTH